eukprot:545714-Prymnesium_polylepis.1
MGLIESRIPRTRTRRPTLTPVPNPVLSRRPHPNPNRAPWPLAVTWASRRRATISTTHGSASTTSACRVPLQATRTAASRTRSRPRA